MTVIVPIKCPMKCSGVLRRTGRMDDGKHVLKCSRCGKEVKD